MVTICHDVTRKYSENDNVLLGNRVTLRVHNSSVFRSGITLREDNRFALVFSRHFALYEKI